MRIEGEKGRRGLGGSQRELGGGRMVVEGNWFP